MDGLRFECQQGCTNCCRVKGFVYVTEKDVTRAAAYLGMAQEEFEKKYIFRSKYMIRLRKPRNNQCFFLKGNGCSIHPAKPTQCRTYPFWPEMVEDRQIWNEVGESCCPGIGKGELIQLGTALEKAQEMRDAYPVIYTLDPID